VRRSSPTTTRETQKKVLVGVLVCVLGLAAAVAVVAPDGRGISIHGARSTMAHRVVMSATRHFQSLDEEALAADAAPADDAAPAQEEAAGHDAAPAAEDKKKSEKKSEKKDKTAKKSDVEEKSSDDKIVLLGDEELNVAMQRYYEAHPNAFQWSLWQQVLPNRCSAPAHFI